MQYMDSSNFDDLVLSTFEVTDCDISDSSIRSHLDNLDTNPAEDKPLPGFDGGIKLRRDHPQIQIWYPEATHPKMHVSDIMFEGENGRNEFKTTEFRKDLHARKDNLLCRRLDSEIADFEVSGNSVSVNKALAELNRQIKIRPRDFQEEIVTTSSVRPRAIADVIHELRTKRCEGNSVAFTESDTSADRIVSHKRGVSHPWELVIDDRAVVTEYTNRRNRDHTKPHRVDTSAFVEHELVIDEPFGCQTAKRRLLRNVMRSAIDGITQSTINIQDQIQSDANQHKANTRNTRPPQYSDSDMTISPLTLTHFVRPLNHRRKSGERIRRELIENIQTLNLTDDYRPVRKTTCPKSIDRVVDNSQPGLEPGVTIIDPDMPTAKRGAHPDTHANLRKKVYNTLPLNMGNMKTHVYKRANLSNNRPSNLDISDIKLCEGIETSVGHKLTNYFGEIRNIQAEPSNDLATFGNEQTSGVPAGIPADSGKVLRRGRLF